MSARDLDFEEVSLMRERSAMLKDGYKSYLQSHPELTQLLGDLVSSCLTHRPEDVFDHAASHFGGKRVDATAAVLKSMRSFKAAIEAEHASEGFDMDGAIRHVFYNYDENHNGTLELNEWLAFVSEVGEGNNIEFQQAESDAMHQWICGEPDGHMTAAQLLHAMAWLGTEDGEFTPLAAADSDAQPAVSAGSSHRSGANAAADDAPATDTAAAAAPRIIISGAPASGKGTQCERLVAKYGIKHISTGDLLRAAVVAETDLGKSAKGHMEKGELVPDELLIPLVAQGLSGVSEGWLLDGFPRTEGQAQALKDAGILPDVLLVLDVPDEELTARCVDRRLDPVGGKIYHLKTNPPENDEIAARLVQRADDTAEKIQTRLKLYHENKDAVCSVFADQVRHVDGNRDADAVNAAICRIVDTGGDAEMDASAAKIQATFRGKQARKQMAKPAPREFSSELEKWAAFKGALGKEAEDGGYEISVLMRHVFFSFDADNNGTCCIKLYSRACTLAWFVLAPQVHWSATSGSLSSTTLGRRIG
jgi:adenylate kinase